MLQPPKNYPKPTYRTYCWQCLLPAQFQLHLNPNRRIRRFPLRIFLSLQVDLWWHFYPGFDWSTDWSWWWMTRLKLSTACQLMAQTTPLLLAKYWKSCMIKWLFLRGWCDCCQLTCCQARLERLFGNFVQVQMKTEQLKKPHWQQWHLFKRE